MISGTRGNRDKLGRLSLCAEERCAAQPSCRAISSAFPPSGIKKEAVSLFRRINLDMLRPLVCRPVLNASAANLQVLRGERKLQ